MYIYKKFKYLTRKRLFSSFFYGVIILLLLITPNRILLAQDTDTPQNTEALQNELNSQIEVLNKEIDSYRESVRQIQGQSNTLGREINLLDSEIKEFELEIKRINLMIRNIESGIGKIELKVEDIERQVEKKKIILGEFIQEIYKYDRISLLEIVLTKENLSDFFSEIESLENLRLGIQKSMEQIRALREDLDFKKSELENQKNELVTLKAVQETQKYSIEVKKKDRKKLLDDTKGQEYLYQRLIKNKQADVNAIRNQLYILQGMGGTLSFANALNIAEFASSATGIRPAFLMAILSRESGLGKNVGTGTWRTDMRANQHSAYLSICEKLGLNPDSMPVSKKAWYGWGGAMGPAQFLPSTWLGYESRIAAVTGHNPPSPWDIEDAFVAAALYLANAGAAAQTYNAEWKAAMIYLAGSNWNKSYLRFYGDQVMSLAASIQEQINLIK